MSASNFNGDVTTYGNPSCDGFDRSNVDSEECSSSALVAKEYVTTGSPFFKCTKLPDHYRINKALPHPFEVVAERPVLDGTEVVVRAGNEDRTFAELKNYSSKMKNNVATFNDFRFVSRSGRGKTFILSITIMTKPPQIVSYESAIKVTVDGPREPRKIKKSTDSEPLPQKMPRSDGDFHLHGRIHIPYTAAEVLTPPQFAHGVPPWINYNLLNHLQPAAAMALLGIPNGHVIPNHMTHHQHPDPTFNGFFKPGPGPFANAPNPQQMLLQYLVSQGLRPDYWQPPLAPPSNFAPSNSTHLGNALGVSQLNMLAMEAQIARQRLAALTNQPPMPTHPNPATCSRHATEVPARCQPPTCVARCCGADSQRTTVNGAAAAFPATNALGSRAPQPTPLTALAALQSILSAAMTGSQARAPTASSATQADSSSYMECSDDAPREVEGRAERENVVRTNGTADEIVPTVGGAQPPMSCKKVEKFGMDHLLRCSSS